jgi:hypothetical protein
MKYEIRLPIPVARPANRVKARAMKIFPSTTGLWREYISICCSIQPHQPSPGSLFSERLQELISYKGMKKPSA